MVTILYVKLIWADCDAASEVEYQNITMINILGFLYGGM
jgi:hypothetical protein